MSNTRYQLNENKIEKMSFRLLYISKASYDSDWHSTQHSHHFTELFYVLRGEGSFIVENERFNVKEDDFITVNPNVLHTEVGKEGSPLEYIVLGIEGLLFAEQNAKEKQKGYTLLNYYDYKHEILFYLKTLVQEIEEKDSNYESVCQNLLEVLVINMLRRTNKSLSVTTTKRTNKECAFIKEYIDQHFTEELTLEALADLTYINKYYLAHAFKKYIGISPINYMIQKRLEEAKSLLETTNYSISQISNIVGFSSQSYFSQVFQKNTKMSPNQYRKSKRS